MTPDEDRKCDDDNIAARVEQRRFDDDARAEWRKDVNCLATDLGFREWATARTLHPRRLTGNDVRARLHNWLHLPVLVEDGHGWYRYVDAVEGPSPAVMAGAEADGYSLPTLLFGRAFDARDL